MNKFANANNKTAKGFSIHYLFNKKHDQGTERFR